MTTRQQADVLIVGAGPAGATCAARLRAGGLDVLLLDKAPFPRPKLCAGWITPAVLDELDVKPEDYAQGRLLQPVTGFRVGLIGGKCIDILGDRPVSYGIRRIEFDAWLLARSQARQALGEPVKTLRRAGPRWIVNDRLEAPMLVAAGGHFCPVARLLGLDVRQRGPVIASQEIEFEIPGDSPHFDGPDPQVPEIYFCRDLLGYGWCIRKGGYMNVGLGRADRQQLPRHMNEFCEFLTRQGRISELPGRLLGHAYLLYGQSTRPLVDEAVLWIGDAAGLAYAQSGEGIRPAIESGLLAAETILAARGDYRRGCLEAYRHRIEARFGPRARQPVDRRPSRLRRWIARQLLGRRWFVEKILLDRWFLHRHERPLGQAE